MNYVKNELYDIVRIVFKYFIIINNIDLVRDRTNTRVKQHSFNQMSNLDYKYLKLIIIYLSEIKYIFKNVGICPDGDRRLPKRL